MIAKAPRGTVDLLGSQAEAWLRIQQVAIDVFSRYGYRLVKTPIFEQQQVFVRGIGQDTDVVGKEMFHVLSKNAFEKVTEGGELKADQKLSLRPEGTAGTIRCAIEHNLIPQGGPTVKLMYAGPMFRCERPQKGRLREFNQIGIECLGAADPSTDAEIIIMLLKFYEELGLPLKSTRLLLNSMGDDACRPAYRETIKQYILDHSAELCEECNHRAQTNPLRAFDCKNPECAKVMDGAPKISDALCDDCRSHYDKVKAYLDGAGIEYIEDPRLVLGLDYYTRTVFELQVIDGLGSQNAIGGGGRYDKLMEVMGGPSTPGIGFALGFERTLLALEAAGVEFELGSDTDVYIACVDDDCKACGFKIMQSLRDAKIRADMDHQGRSLKSQFKQAGKMGASYVVVVGPDEMAAGEVTLRCMDTHEEERCAIDEVAEQVASRMR